MRRLAPPALRLCISLGPARLDSCSPRVSSRGTSPSARDPRRARVQLQSPSLEPAKARDPETRAGAPRPQRDERPSSPRGPRGTRVRASPRAVPPGLTLETVRTLPAYVQPRAQNGRERSDTSCTPPRREPGAGVSSRFGNIRVRGKSLSPRSCYFTTKSTPK